MLPGALEDGHTRRTTATSESPLNQARVSSEFERASRRWGHREIPSPGPGSMGRGEPKVHPGEKVLVSGFEVQGVLGQGWRATSEPRDVFS